MAVGQGHNAYLGFVTQSSLGSLTTRTKFLDIVSESIAAQLMRKHSSNLGSASRRLYTEVGAQSGGGVQLEANFEGMDTLLYHAFGTKAAAQQGGTAAYKHTLTLAAGVPAIGLSVEVARDITGFFYEGCKVAALTFQQDPNDFLKVAIELLGRQETRGSATSPTFPSALPIHQSQMVATVDAGAVTMNKLMVKLDNKLAQRPQLGNVAPKEIIRTGGREVTGSFEIDFEDQTQYAKFMANTSAALIATWTGAIIASSFAYALVLTLPKIFYTGGTPVVSGRGPITVPFTFDAVEQTRGAQDEFKIELTNTATSIA